MGDLYDGDILEWSERQAAWLRRVAAGEPPDDPPDWENIIEEVESVGREQLHAVESLLAQAICHMLNAAAWPNSSTVPGWQAEARRCRDDAASRFSPSMRQHIDMAKIHARAVRAMPAMIDEEPPLPVATTLQFTLDELLFAG